MGKYSGIVLLTDFDFTLFTGEEIPPENIAAIKKFCDEGGKFGYASGRTAGFFKKMDEKVKPNTYIATVNGTVIYDYPRERVQLEKFMPSDACERTVRLCKELDFYKRYSNMVLFSSKKVEGIPFGETNSADDFYGKLRELFSKPMNKIMFHGKYPVSDEEKRSIECVMGDAYVVSRSWAEGVEIQAADATKGDAAREIKRLCGADLLVCAGDYENDISMIKAADIGYAVGNAIESVKAVADRVTVRVDEGAVAKIIEELGSL